MEVEVNERLEGSVGVCDMPYSSDDYDVAAPRRSWLDREVERLGPVLTRSEGQTVAELMRFDTKEILFFRIK